MEKLIKKIKPKFYWIVTFLLGSLSMYIMLSYAQMLSTGKYILLAGDALDYVANIHMFAGNILRGETIWYSFASFLGMNTAPGLAEVMFSPFNVLYIMFYNADVNVITAIVVILKTGLAAATFQIFASRTLKIHNYYSILFAVFYSMCSFAVLYGIIHFMWLEGLYILPMVAFATDKAVREAKYSLLTILYSYIIVAQMYQSYLIIIFSLMYFVLLLCLMKKDARRKPAWKHVIRYICSLAISVMIASFILLPVILYRLSNPNQLSFQGTETTLMHVFNNLFWGEVQDFSIAPYVYSGIPCLLLLPFYFINKKIAIRERIVYAVMIAFFAIACIFSPFLAFLHAFGKVEIWNYRFGFILVFLICAVACKEAVYIKQIKAKSIFFYCIFLILFFIVEGRLEKLEIGSISHNNLLGLFVNFVFAVLWVSLATIFIKKSKHRMTISVLFIFIALGECISNGCYCLASDEYRSFVEREDYYYSWHNDMDKVVSEIGRNERGDILFRIVVSGDYNRNSDALCNYYGLTDYGSFRNDKISRFLQDMGLYVEDNRISATGITPPIEMLLSVKYKVGLHSDMAVMGAEMKPDISENNDYLPIAFMVNEDALVDTEMTNNSFENQNQIFSKLSAIDSLYTPVDNNLITRDEYGLLLSEDESPILYSDNAGGGLIVFRVSDKEDPVYMQISSTDLGTEEQQVYYDNSGNMMFYDDNFAGIPFTAKLWQSKDKHYLSLRAEEGQSIYFPTGGVFIYELNTDKMNEIKESLMREAFVPEKIQNGYLKGTVSVVDDRRILLTSVPYEKGWEVTVNNSVGQCVPVLNDTFLGIVLPDKGLYEIELKYHCPGARLGGIISLCGIVLLSLQFFFAESGIKKHRVLKR